MAHAAAAPFHIGLTPERVIDVAWELTGESHLSGWSIRDLAKRLEVAPSVIYHHVGGKDMLARYVVERVLTRLALPDASLEWREWFRSLLLSGYPVIAASPGVAKWLLMHGPTFPSVVPIVEAGMSALVRGGFGDRAGIAYAALLNNAMLTITIGDDRLVHEDDGPRDHATMMTEFRQASIDSPGLTDLAEGFITPFARGGEDAARQREDYYRFIVDSTIAGIAATLQVP